jgi:hypothetical protein
LTGAGQQDDTIEILHFTAFDFVIFLVENSAVSIGGGEQFADGGSTGAAVRHADDHLRVKIVLTRPALPDSRNGGSGVDEHAVQVKEQSAAAGLDHCF